MGIAVIFPGQGTQTTGMGAPWRDDPAWGVVDRAETALGEPLSSLILDAPAEQLARTREAQLAVLLTSLVAWEAVRERIEAPIAFAGHSLGQVTALIASGALPLEEGVQFASRRAELTQAAADTHPGRMAALLGASLEQAEAACRAAPDGCWIANDNAPGQVVIAGTPDGVEEGSAEAKELGVKRATPLNVGGAFHTPLMRDAAEGLAAELPAVPLSPPDAPVVSNGDAQPYEDADGWRSRLAVHVTDPVRWRTSMETIAGMGVTRFLEVGNGSMLATLAKRIVPDLPVLGVATPDDLPALTEVR
ncbi:MAG TPA: ACP S-malonyltransferase [Acidimicrobiia bacterium]|nr:ACP S-malonyltransferase [Acidimicrobiia bacterium]